MLNLHVLFFFFQKSLFFFFVCLQYVFYLLYALSFLDEVFFFMFFFFFSSVCFFFFHFFNFVLFSLFFHSFHSINLHVAFTLPFDDLHFLVRSLCFIPLKENVTHSYHTRKPIQPNPTQPSPTQRFIRNPQPSPLSIMQNCNSTVLDFFLISKANVLYGFPALFYLLIPFPLPQPYPICRFLRHHHYHHHLYHHHHRR